MDFFKSLKENKILKNSITLINGTIISQAINVIMSPIMSRLYSPGDFGNYSTITAIVSIITIIATGKYDLAIMDSKDTKKECKSTYYLGMILTIITCLIVLILGTIYVEVSSVYNMLDIALIAIFTFFASNNSILNIWLNKNGYYKQISKNRIIYSVVHIVCIVVFGFLKTGYLGIAFSAFLSYLAQCIYVYIFLKKKTDFNDYKIDFDEIKIQAKKHIKFPKFQMPSLLLNTASTQMPILLFTNFFGSQVSGWYSMTIRIINLPMTIIGNSVGEIFFKEASEIEKVGDRNRLSEFTYSTFKKIMLIGLVPMTLLICYGDILFSFVLGQEWYMAGIYAMILSPWYYIVFVTSPFTHLFTVLNMQKKNLVINIIMLISRVLCIVIGAFAFTSNSLATIIIFAIVGFLIWVFFNGYLFKLIGISYKKSVLNVIIILAVAVFIAIIPRIIFKF